MACEPPTVLARFSTVQPLGDAGSTLSTARSAADLVAAVSKELERRGFLLVDKGETRTGVQVYVFRGSRSSATVVTEAANQVGIRTIELGSVFYALVQPIPAGVNPSGARLFLFGKPTVNGADLCSDVDARLIEFGYQCKDVAVEEGSSFRASITGREETDVVRGVLLTLTATLPPVEGVPLQ
jgi:hypothetical protein